MDDTREQVGRLRRQYRSLAQSRAAIEDRMLRSREYFEGSIATIEHKNKGGTSTPYYYISMHPISRWNSRDHSIWAPLMLRTDRYM